MPPTFTVEVRLGDGRALLGPSGDLDLATGPVVTDAVTTQLRAPLTGLGIDLSAVSFCDCAGLHALHRARELSTDRNVPFGVFDPPRQFLRLIQLTGSDILAVPREGDLSV